MSEFYTFGKQFREFIWGLLNFEKDGGNGGPPPGGEGQAHFPPAGIDIIDHDLRIEVDIGATGGADETITMHGKMMIKRGDPYVNENGLRQIDFDVLSWVASGWSRSLGRDIVYTLSEDVEQPTSTIVAEKEGSDYPATFLFNVIFDARTGNRTVFRRHHGRPEGYGFFEVPPTGNRRTSPTITQFEDQRIVVDHPEGGQFRFKPVDCNDQDSQTVQTFGRRDADAVFAGP